MSTPNHISPVKKPGGVNNDWKVNKRILKKVTVLGAIIAIILSSEYTFALSGIRAEPGVKIKIEREWKGHNCGYTEPSRLVIKTGDQWREIWKKVNALKLPRPELPKIDFEKEMVVAIFMGERSSGGYKIEIINIIKTEKQIVIEVEEEEPPPESLRTMALTQPYHIVVIKRYPLPVVFSKLGSAPIL